MLKPNDMTDTVRSCFAYLLMPTMLFTVSPTGTTAGGYYGLRLDRTSQSSSSGSIPSILARGMKDGFRGSFPSMTKF